MISIKSFHRKRWEIPCKVLEGLKFVQENGDGIIGVVLPLVLLVLLGCAVLGMSFGS